MTQTAKHLPDNQRVALYIRHCERYTDPPDGDYSKLLLTPTGILQANKMGESIDRKIGICAVSPVERCQQTMREILKGVQKPYAPDEGTQIIPVEAFAHMTGDPRPKEVGGVGWYEYFNFLQNGDSKGTRGVTLKDEVKPILDGIFNTTLTSPDSHVLDLICSHDGHVVMLASALFDFKTPPYYTDEWCQYAEGIFFFGTRNNFTAIWRNQTKTFTDFMIE